MSNEPSRKEQLRQAALRELERRSLAYEERVRQVVLEADWGTAIELSPLIKDNLVRLGAVPQAPESHNAVDMLISDIAWPADVEFRGSTNRFRETMLASGLTAYEQMSEIELQDAMPHRCIDFRFLPALSLGSFYSGWESDFAAVDSTQLFPFATDSHYFYLIGANSNDLSDPLVYTVDHETTDEIPRSDPHSTVGRLLAILAKA